VLAPAIEGFPPTSEFPEFETAQTLLAALAHGDGVQRAAAMRRRRVQLQLAYGNALIAARGHGAPEMTAAFARARELAAGIEDPAERFSVYYGLWVGSFVRSELAPMQEVSEAARQLAERFPDSGEAGVAWRIHGLTHWYQGDFTTARAYLERALASFDPARDNDLAYRFGQDVGVSFMNYLAFALWPLGEIERARQLEEAAVLRARGTGHVATLAYAEFFKALFEMLRNDARRAAPHAGKTVELAREHNLPEFAACGGVVNGWARAALALQLLFCFEVRSLSERLVSSTPE